MSIKNSLSTAIIPLQESVTPSTETIDDFLLQVHQGAFRNIVTSKLYLIMEEAKINKSILAKRIGVSKAAISVRLSGDNNLTLDSVTQLALAVGYTPSISFKKIGDDSNNDYSDTEITEYKCKDYVDITVSYSQDNLASIISYRHRRISTKKCYHLLNTYEGL
jgi:transcriptional regulator with XRE-family HTH domain